MADHFEELLDRLVGVRRRGDQAYARCPAHDDHKSSLSIARTDHGQILITCHAGCSWQDVITAAGMEISDAFGAPRIIREHTYTDQYGTPLYVVERWEPKTFRQRMANGVRRAPKAHERVLYNLPAVMQARADHRGLFLTEGEHDADTLAGLGYIATTTLGGANKPWCEQYTDALRGLHVVITAHNDDAGKRWARQMVRYLRPDADPVVVIPPKGVKDVTELIEAGYEVSAMLPLPDAHGRVSTARTVPTKAVEWLWPARLPANMLTLLEGDPGVGKSTLISEVIGCLTTGRPLPGAQPSKYLRVGVLSDEDSWSAVVVPRLMAAEADLDMVFHFEGIEGSDGILRPYSLLDLATLRDDLQTYNIDVLVIDPLVAYLGLDMDSHKDQHVRLVLGPLADMAERDHLTIIAVRHFTKNSIGGKAIYRGGGSIGFVGQARVVLQAAEHPEMRDDGPQRFVLAVAKNNMAPLPTSLGYKIAVHERLEVGHIAWEELPVPVSAAMLAKPPPPPEAAGPGREARDWLDEWLSDGQPHSWKEIVAAGREAGHTARTLERHRYEVAVREIGGRGNRDSVWRTNRVSPTLPLRHPDRGRPDGEVGRSEGKWESDETEARPYWKEREPDDEAHFTPLRQPDVSGPGGEVGCSVCGGTDSLMTIKGELRCRHHWGPLL